MAAPMQNINAELPWVVGVGWGRSGSRMRHRPLPPPQRKILAEANRLLSPSESAEELNKQEKKEEEKPPIHFVLTIRSKAYLCI